MKKVLLITLLLGAILFMMWRANFYYTPDSMRLFVPGFMEELAFKEDFIDIQWENSEAELKNKFRLFKPLYGKDNINAVVLDGYLTSRAQRTNYKVGSIMCTYFSEKTGEYIGDDLFQVNKVLFPGESVPINIRLTDMPSEPFFVTWKAFAVQSF